MRRYKLLGFVFISILLLSIGFASFSSDQNIESALAHIKISKPTRITNALVSESNHGGFSSNVSYNHDKIYDNISLPYDDSTITYKIDVTVFTNDHMKISNITINENLDFELLNYDYDALCNSNNICSLGATDEILLKVKYKQNAYNEENTSFFLNITFTFSPILNVAKIGSQYFSSIQEAVFASQDNTETKIYLLKNVSEVVVIPNEKDLIIDLGGFTITNNISLPIIENNGVLKLLNGTITSNASQGAINNNNSLVIDNINIYATGVKQAIYNAGSLSIKGNSILSSTSKDRATVQNLQNGSINIISAKISSSRFRGIENAGNLTIGEKNDKVDEQIEIAGHTYGINSTTDFNFYGGKIKGKEFAISDETKIVDKEANYDLFHEEEESYKIARLALTKTIYFDALGGTISADRKVVELNQKAGILPTPEKSDLEFVGWFKEKSFETLVDENTIITDNITLYAKYIRSEEFKLCKIGENYFTSFDDALNSISNNNPASIKLLRNASLNITIPSGKNIILDMQGFKLTNNTGYSVITNNGTLKLLNGIILSRSNTASAVNNNPSGSLILENINVSAEGARQALYNDGGTAYLLGTSSLSSIAKERSTVQNLSGGYLNIISANIYSKYNSGILNQNGILTLGEKNNSINTTNPLILGTYGVTNESTFNFYDGLIGGTTSACDGNISDIPDNSNLMNIDQELNSVTYNSIYLTN